MDRALEVWNRTPGILYALLSGLSDEWLNAREYKEGWSPREILAHLILGEKTDWIPRTKIMLNSIDDGKFQPFDMESHLDYARLHDVGSMLIEFSELRKQNVKSITELKLTEKELSMTGIHPEFGQVTLREHLSAWVTHDMSHLSQIARIIAKEYKDDAGPWASYMKVLQDQ